MSSVAISFGRYNPPHLGHVNTWKICQLYDNWHIGTNQKTNDVNNPLPIDVKVKVMIELCPVVREKIISTTSWLTLCSEVFNKYRNSELTVVTDKIDKNWILPLIKKYNNIESKHGFYNFEYIKYHQAPRLYSATQLRNAVAKGDFESFSSCFYYTSITFDVLKYFRLIDKYMKINQEDEWTN